MNKFGCYNIMPWLLYLLNYVVFYLNKLCNALFVTTKLKKFDSTNVVF